MSRLEHDPPHGLDFDSWARLAKDDPESFEATRLAAIEGLIQSFPAENRERMRRLQWRIDQERRLAKSPMGACLRLSRMMWQQFGGLRERLSGVADDLQADAAAGKAPQRDARSSVLALFRPPE